ncbi:hypothetical protein AB1I63_00355 [Streptococcus pneumoniae]
MTEKKEIVITGRMVLRLVLLLASVTIIIILFMKQRFETEDFIPIALLVFSISLSFTTKK